MKKQTIVYLAMILFASGALWAVLRIGARLEAAADLGGAWTFDSGPLGPEADGPERLGKGFHIDQSGRFLRFRFDNGRQLDLRAEQLPQGQIGNDPMPVELADGRWQLSGTVRQENGKLIGSFTLRGPERARFIAYRAPAETERAPTVAPSLPARPPDPQTPAPQTPAPQTPAPAADAGPVVPVVALEKGGDATTVKP